MVRVLRHAQISLKRSGMECASVASMSTFTLPHTWTIHAKDIGRVHGCGPYRTRQDALAAIRDRARNGVAFASERPAQIMFSLRWDGRTMHAIDLNGE